MLPDLNTFGFQIPEGLTRYAYAGEQDRHACHKCGCWLPDHEFNETCEWQCQNCGKLTPPDQGNLLRIPFLTVCDACYEAEKKHVLVAAGLLPEPPHAE